MIIAYYFLYSALVKEKDRLTDIGMIIPGLQRKEDKPTMKISVTSRENAMQSL